MFRASHKIPDRDRALCGYRFLGRDQYLAHHHRCIDPVSLKGRL